MIDGVNGESTYGIWSNKNNIVIKNCNISNWKVGIKFHIAYNEIINNNTIYSNIDGIFLYKSSGNIILANNIYYNKYGIKIHGSSNDSEIKNNRIVLNEKGIHITSINARSNLIYNNYFNNTNNAEDKGNNFWNTANQTGTNIVGGPYIGGNYFSDYMGLDANGDGFGDIPYNIKGTDSKDHLSLIMIAEVPTIFLSIGLMFFSMLRMKRKIK